MGQVVTKAVTIVQQLVRSMGEWANSPSPIPHWEIAYLTRNLAEDAVKPWGHMLGVAASMFNVIIWLLLEY